MVWGLRFGTVSASRFAADRAPLSTQSRERKRHNPDDAPDARREVAEYIAARLGELHWEVSDVEPRHPFNPPRGESGSEPPAEDRHGQAQ